MGLKIGEIAVKLSEENFECFFNSSQKYTCLRPCAPRERISRESKEHILSNVVKKYKRRFRPLTNMRPLLLSSNSIKIRETF